MKIKKKKVFIYLLFFLILLFLISFKPEITGMQVIITGPTKDDADKPKVVISVAKYPTEDYSLKGIYYKQGASISKRTIPCINVSTTEKEIVEIKEEDLKYKIPKDHSIILKPFSLECNGDIELTVSIPDNFIDVKALKCRGNKCYPTNIFSINNLECGGEFVKEISRETEYLEPQVIPIRITKTELYLNEYKKKMKSGKNEIEFYGDVFEDLFVIMNKHSQPIKEAKNPSLKIIGTPLVITLSNVDVPSNSIITMPYIEEENIEKDSYAIYVKKNELWNYIGGNINKGEKIINADVVNIEQYANENNEIIFAVMGILCTYCLDSSFEKIYDNGKDAIILIHGFMSSPSTYKELIDGIVLTQQPFQVWTFGYPTAKDIKKNANDLSYYLELNKDEYDSIYIIGHSLGGIIAQQALFLSDNFNFEYLKKVKKVILIAASNEGSPTAEVYENLINQIINSDKYKAYNTRNIVKDLINGVITPKVEGIDYNVIAGTKSYILTEDLFDSTNDGIITVKSAQHVGDSYINDKCKNYWELYKTHTQLIDDVLPRKIIEKIISQDLKDEISILGNNQYFKLVDKCYSGDKYLFIGKEIKKEEIADPTGCSCGNRFCGVDEDEVSCPSDCTRINQELIYVFFSVIIIILVGGIIIEVILLKKMKK